MNARNFNISFHLEVIVTKLRTKISPLFRCFNCQMICPNGPCNMPTQLNIYNKNFTTSFMNISSALENGPFPILKIPQNFMEEGTDGKY